MADENQVSRTSSSERPINRFVTCKHLTAYAIYNIYKDTLKQMADLTQYWISRQDQTCASPNKLFHVKGSFTIVNIYLLVQRVLI